MAMKAVLARTNPSAALSKRKQASEKESSQPEKKSKDADGKSQPIFRNKQRVLVFGSRGITQRYRHLMSDLRTMLVHSKKDVKMDQKDNLHVINEIAEMKNCNNCIYFEMRKRQDLYVWISKTPNGPSVKFHCTNVHTMEELKITGNCLKGSRPFLMFDPTFDAAPHLLLMKEMLSHAFGTPNNHPKSKPFIDHIISFFVVDGRIWFRNYQVVEPTEKKGEPRLVEIGPRFVMNPIKILAGSFSGQTLYENPRYVSPNKVRRLAKLQKAGKYTQRLSSAQQLQEKKTHLKVEPNPLEELFLH